MIQQTLMAIGTLTSVVVPGQSTGELTELSATFHTRIPIITVYAPQHGSIKAVRFVLDSGAMNSRHLRMKSEGSRTFFADPACKLEISKVNFLPLAEASVPLSLQLELKKMRVDGMFGFDFFNEHDIVIDYERSKVFISKNLLSPEWVARNVEWFKKLKLTDYYLWKTVLTKNPKNERAFNLLVFDTGASITCLPTTGYENEINSDVEPYHLYTIDGTIVGKRLERELTVDGYNATLRAKVFVGPATPLFSPSDFGSRLLIQFRQNTVWKLKPEFRTSSIQQLKEAKATR